MSTPVNLHADTLRGIAFQLRMLARSRYELADAARVRAAGLATPYLVEIELAHASAHEAMARSYLVRALDYEERAKARERSGPRRIAARAPRWRTTAA